ncbi:MAG TPA: xanthine dehydrogenase family protein molybdopterin-binding subunit [Pseudolabrys sp.]|jgi:carbon-monoxide dehydrogenase large subunit|uniref:xanthine dehydrogenase family protein molybdopterin-binding subunit n=1 Tax=Pseudolabrys sp. TaxID=1960880 RepID=UPI002DDD0B67|nr:xanthine dehydrogenase family protein molybdopterin-binding subunit [Pseudolabrys sp.]HEV2629208.1 xanthine dehydrogenase family protein molybdopterin-binding subunit [Pseudolabrys sp.]
MSEATTIGNVIGASIPRRELNRLVSGKGRYIDDIKLPRMLHLAYVRSPHPHARIKAISTEAALAAAGVEAVLTAAEINPMCQPLVGVAQHRPGHRSPPQKLLAEERALWQGQPVAAVVAATRAEAEDAAALVEIAWEPLEPVWLPHDALDARRPVVHPELGDNVAFDFSIEKGNAAKAFAEAAVIVGDDFRFERQQAMTLEARGLIADFNSADGTLTVHHAHQSPFQMQDLYSRHFDIPEHKVKVVAPDIGGGFGMKLNVYTEELAAVAASIRLGRPVKYCADRLEAFLGDAHARDHVMSARMAVSADGKITAMEVDDVGAVGAYGMPLRFNVAEGMMLITMCGAPYDFSDYKARTRSVYVNKNLIGMYRGVGMPFACILPEVLADRAANQLGIDPVEFRRRNFRRKETFPCLTPGGQRLQGLSLQASLDKLVVSMDYDALRAEQTELRKRSIYRGIGIATFLEQTAYGPPYYGPSGARISTQDGCHLRLEPSGTIRCVTSITDQGQGTLTGIAQIVADSVGVGYDDVGMIAGDSTISPYGGGAWASRGMMVGGEAALGAGRKLKANILALAGAITQTPLGDLDIVASQVVNTGTGMAVISLADVAKIGYFRQDTLPPKFDVQLSVTHSFVTGELCYIANGVQASYVELDPETGFIKMLGQWAVDDCGRIINPLLVNEQVRGGIAQGIGAVLYEECMYGPEGYLENGTMIDYLLPMAADLPDIVVEHVETPEASTDLGAKGIGEAGLIGAMGAVWVAVNDALAPFGTAITHQPFTPERVLDALAKSTRG